MHHTKILHNVYVLQVLHVFDFGVQRLDTLPSRTLVSEKVLWDVDLFHGKKLTGIDVHAQINTAIGALADQLTAEPFERR